MSVNSECIPLDSSLAYPLDRPNGTAKRSRRFNRVLFPPAQFSIVTGPSERQSLEHYIAQRFDQAYQAKVNEFLPHLVRVTCCGNTSAAVGIRCAAESPLFVEQYMECPVEQKLSEIGGQTKRESIAELGNLVASHRGVSQLLFLVIANSLYLADIEWVIFVATKQVASLVKKFQCPVKDLGKADPGCLSDGGKKWGSYYATDPHLLAMHLPTARRHVQSSLKAGVVLHLYKTTCGELAQQLSQAFQLAAFTC